MDHRRVGGHVSRWAGLAVTRDRAVNKPPIGRAEHGVVEAKPPHDPRTVVLDENVGISCQPTSGGHCAFSLEVEHDALLAGIELAEVAAGAAAQRQAGAHHVALWRFDLDHLRTKVSE